MRLEFLVPFYGDPGLLRLTVASVLAQHHPDWRLTVVDDGYPDPAVAQWFAGIADPRVSYLRNETNLGANGNYRRCVELADADLVVILGADDELLPNYADTVLGTAGLFPDAAVVQPGVEVIDQHGAPARSLADTVKQRLLRPRATDPVQLGGETLAASLLRGNWLYFPSLAFRREPLQEKGFRAGFDVVQDLALVIDLVADGHPLALDPTVCFRYRRHSGSDSSVRAVAGGRFAEERAYFTAAADQMDALGWRKAATAARHHLMSRANALTTVPAALRAGRRDAVRPLARHALGPSR